ncbi:hypothetical protein Peur_011730 [Populus x canadensis]
MFSCYRSRAPVFGSNVDDFLPFPLRVQWLLLTKPLIQISVILLVVPPATQTLAIPDLNRTPMNSTLKVLIGVLVIVFPDLRDFDKVMAGCSFAEDAFDGGLIFWPLSFCAMELQFDSLVGVNWLFVCGYRIPRLRFVSV